jgi:parallel beta-helix repeat protein
MKHRRKHNSYKRSRRAPIIAAIIVVPFAIALVTFYYIFGPGLMSALATRGDNRLITQGWQSAEASMQSAEPIYGPKYSYYKLEQGQNLQWASQHFGVDLATLEKLNPGQPVMGTTIKVIPVESPLTAFPATKATTAGLTVTVAPSTGVITVDNVFTGPTAYVTIPQLMRFLQPYGAITQLGPKSFLINKPLYIQGNIRTDITSTTVQNLYLLSAPNYQITTLTIRDSEALIDGVNISSYDPNTKGPDTNYKDGRSFLRAYGSARMDVLNSHISYLGMTKAQATNPALQTKLGFISQGGAYGASWRISSGQFGADDTTGWVQNSTFEHNYIGAFTFGAQGMMWRNSIFSDNTIYGLDPHDDSDNATIEYNEFIGNGHHGFIVSKRCDYNTIKDNISIDNKLHGFMLHDNSDYNIFEGNVAIGNYDNYVMYNSNFDMVKDNKGYDPRGSQVRINQASVQDYITDNTFYGGPRGVYLYGNDNGVDISDNTFDNVAYQLDTDGATRVLFTGNVSNNLGYKLNKRDRVVFGVNTINKSPSIDLQPLLTIQQGQKDGTALADLANTARTE